MSEAEANLFLDFIGSATFYLEWGCGGSTLAAVRSKARHIVSVDTDPVWINRLKENGEIAAAVTANRLVFRHIDVGPTGQWGVPTGDSKLRNWPRYALAPFVGTDLDFDSILVDGRFRVHCLLAVANCAADRTSVFLHDYAFRHSYTIADKYFDTIKRADSGVILKRRANHRSHHFTFRRIAPDDRKITLSNSDNVVQSTTLS